jgi:hypothetical protein
MSTFRWEISESAQGDAALGVNSGTVNLEQVTAVNAPAGWRIELPDGSVAIVPQRGGEVELNNPPTVKETEIVSRNVINFGLIVFILLVALIVINDVFTRGLSFTQFAQVILSFLAGFGVRNFKREQSKAQSARSTKRRIDA